MKNNKPEYYTPELEEFCVGFEYESNLQDEGWEKEIFEPNRVDDSILINMFFSKIKNIECYRVRYLNQEDIEECGWEFHSQPNKNCFVFNLVKDSFCRMTVNFDKPTKLSFYHYEGWETPDFKIKNKTELLKLMKQIGINE